MAATILHRRLLFRLPVTRLSKCWCSTTTIQSNSSVDQDDVHRHSQLAQDWWNLHGPMKMLHQMNRIRVPFIRDGLIGTQKVCKEAINTSAALSGLQILEVGCGAGILTEALARIHAQVTAIDPGIEVIDVAKKHLLQYDTEFQKRIDYRNESIEDHLSSGTNCNKYDAIVVSEVLEHVVDKSAFLATCLETLKPGGSIFITTFNKTCMSWAGAIVVAEYLLRLIPKGTHDWDRFIPPIETERILNEKNCTTVLVNGFVYELWRDEWKWIDSKDVSYALHAVKLK